MVATVQYPYIRSALQVSVPYSAAPPGQGTMLIDDAIHIQTRRSRVR